jgi:hypothetical protein
LWIADFCVGRGGSLFVVTKEGDGYELSHTSKSKTVLKSESFSDISKSKTSDISKSKSDNFSDILKVKCRLPCVYRAVSISCDPKGKNFGVLQVCPNAELSDLPDVDSSSMKSDFRTLFEHTDEFDPLHDLEIQVGDRKFFAHKFILANSCEKISKMVRTDEDVVRISDPIPPEIFEQILQFVYHRSCDLMKVGPTNFRLKKSDIQNGQRSSENGQNFFSVAGDSANTSAFKVYSENGKNSSKNNPKKPTKKSPKKADNDTIANPILALTEASKLLGMSNLTACISCYKYSNGNIEKIPNAKTPTFEQQNIRYSRKSFPEFYDVSIKTEDGVEMSAHRCVLAARLDYFRFRTFFLLFELNLKFDLT